MPCVISSTICIYRWNIFCPVGSVPVVIQHLAESSRTEQSAGETMEITETCTNRYIELYLHTYVQRYIFQLHERAGN